jgi:preprotein translocase subunit SecA
MLGKLASKLFGSNNERQIRRMQPTVDEINALEAEYEKLSDKQLQSKTDEFKTRLKAGETTDDILVEAFATVREASKRMLAMRHFDVQLIGGIVLHRGMIAEMRTGEGKTLVATLAVYLNALEGKGVHVVTVNDYLASRDAEWMGEIYKFLGLSVGVIINDITEQQRKDAYKADITYGTNNEFGFDYLRDNMRFSIEDMVQRKFNYAIVDEVDSILIDEARTPLIISGASEDSSDLYVIIDKYIPMLSKEAGDFEIDEKSRTVTMTDEGTTKIEDQLRKDGVIDKDSTLYDIHNISIVHHVNQALKAHNLFERDTDYIVHEDQVVIIDEFTGRMMEGRRYSEGLHQALEAREGVKIQTENQTLASITFQNYFRMYPKLAGMTGTAMTEAGEFEDIYKLRVIDIPTNVPVGRIDDDDEIYRTSDERYAAIVERIADCYKRGQPTLVGTVSIEKSEYLSSLLKKKKIPHNVLNARQHDREAEIIAQAGESGAVTIATNMAGRGTDIKLGGNPEMMIKNKFGDNPDPKEAEKIIKATEEDKKKVIEAGGLAVLGSERHESRRIDNQLRGRSGRQGDPGFSQFFLSLEDDLMRIFGSERIDGVLQKLGLKDGEAIIHPWISRALEKAQEKVEGRNYEIRKNLLKYDDVMNDQRKVIYEQRIDLMEAEDLSDMVVEMREEIIEELVMDAMPEKSYAEQWEIESLEKEIFHIFGLHLPIDNWAKEEGIANEEIIDRIKKEVKKLFAEKIEEYGEDVVREAEKRIILYTLDQLWKDHLLSLDHLRQGINLRAYAQKDPLNEYKREAFIMFESMINHVRDVMIDRLAHLQVQIHPGENIADFGRKEQNHQETRTDPAAAAIPQPQHSRSITPITNKPTGPADPDNPETWGKVKRNETCPCGSGKKYKHCHGKLI